MIELVAQIILYTFLMVSFLLLSTILLQKRVNIRKSLKSGFARDYLFKRYFDYEEAEKQFSNRFFFDAFIEVETQVSIDPVARSLIVSDLMATGFCMKQFKRLHRHGKNKRKIASFYLGALKHEEAYLALQKQLKREKDDSVRFYIFYALREIMDEENLNVMINSLSGSRESYQTWIRAVLNNNFDRVEPYLESYVSNPSIEVKRLMLYLASNQLNPTLKAYAINAFQTPTSEPEIRQLAIEALSLKYPEEMSTMDFCNHEDEMVKRLAIKSSSTIITEEMVDRLLKTMDGSHLDDLRIQSLSRIVFESKSLLLYLLNSYPKYVTDKHVRLAISRVLSHRIDYMMLKLMTNQYPFVKEIINDLLSMHVIEDFIDFMNHNMNVKLEDVLIEFTKKHLASDDWLLDEFTIYLDQRILKKMGLIKRTPPMAQRERAPRERKKIIWLIKWLVIGFLILPVLFLVENFQTIIGGSTNVFFLLIVRFNYYLIFYFMFLNSTYAIILLFSLKGAKDRIDLWKIKKQTLLFEHHLLPSISIIAPAFNEEKSIIESVNSLLNLKYPTYEVVVVNDGSKDNTIQVLIDYFKLERKHPFFKTPLETKALRGVYVNKHIPNLIVIDKQNGGKADALNMGINVAKSDYVCGIDADSLLEEDALLKLISVTLDDTKPHIALGGNIIPVNGCIVDQGKIEHRGLGKNWLVRLQTLEYLRAFTTGRIGWSKIKSLLIISGAFGLFKRQALLETGGYLTISGKLKKDTVGEDMELVVRLTYQALSRKEPYRVEYVHHANCYTELPSDFSSLLKQRNRWQRGLIDILSYHRRILFNPRFKQPGMIGFPYFFIFEVIGPMIELLGYLSIVFSLIFVLLNPTIFMLLFVVGIGYGIVISLFSLLIAERKQKFYSFGETILLIFLAIIENFGYRQIMSVHRVVATIKSINESGSWGSQKRKGFQKKT